MNKLSIELQENADEVTVSLNGRVELSSVPWVWSQVTRGLGDRRLVLDFTHGEIGSDAALGALVDSAPGQRVICRGLRDHHERLVSYFCPRAPRA